MKRKKSPLNSFIAFWEVVSQGRLRLFSFLTICLFLLFLPGQNYYSTLELQYQPPLVRASEFDDFLPSKYPQKVTSEPAPYTSAESVVVLDQESGATLYQVNPEEKLYPASLTKLMTALVALDFYQPSQTLTVKRLAEVPYESDMGLAVGDRVGLQSLLYGLLVPSGGDAAYTLADNYPGGIENFIYTMNQKAKELHMDNTHFENPSGFDSPSHYSTGKEIALLAREVLKSNLLNRIIATYGVTVTDATGKKAYTLKNVNQFLGYLYGADGVKTGFTDLAGECLVASVSRDGHRIISVVLKSSDRFGDSARLIEWVFRNFQWVTPTETGI